VAFIYKGASAVGAPVSPLVRAPFDRQRDTLKLARMGNADCKRLWNDFVTEAPALARLVLADVEQERQHDAAAKRWGRFVAAARHEHRSRGVRPPMYWITGHYPMTPPTGRYSRK
jgi:hypothetical protein